MTRKDVGKLEIIVHHRCSRTGRFIDVPEQAKRSNMNDIQLELWAFGKTPRPPQEPPPAKPGDKWQQILTEAHKRNRKDQ